jgi:hypothetical protein
LKRLAVLVLAGIALAVPVVTRAQEATPAGTVVPAPEECTVAPLTRDQLIAILATPAAPAPAPASPTPFVMPAGEPVDAATATAVQATIHEFIACLNARDYWRAYALYTDDFLRESLAGVTAADLTQEAYDQLATPTPLAPEERAAIVEYREIVALPDGRVAVLVVGDDPTNPRPPAPALVYLIEVEGRWLIDGVVSSQEIAGTPEP